MSEALKLVTEEIEVVTETKELISILRSVGKEAVLFLLDEKCNIKESPSKSLGELAQTIESNTEREALIGCLVETKDCYSSVHEETFLEFCAKHNVQGIVYNEPFKISVIRCYLQKSEYFQTIKVFSAINKEKQFDEFRGKPVEEPVAFQRQHEDEMKNVIDDLIEKGRKYIISSTQIQDNIVMTAHFETRKRNFTTISQGKSIETVTITPTTKAVAKYNIKENKLSVKGGPSTKLKDCIIQTFGQVFFKDNSHFTGENFEIYKLERVTNSDFSLALDEELQGEVISAVIKEEMLNVPIDGDEIKLTVAAKDVERALEFLSNENIDLKSQVREQVKIEITLKLPEDRTKKITVTITNNSKINFNPQYSAIVHKCLTKWGIEIGA
jgi:hypothetical protein